MLMPIGFLKLNLRWTGKKKYKADKRNKRNSRTKSSNLLKGVFSVHIKPSTKGTMILNSGLFFHKGIRDGCIHECKKGAALHY